MMPENLIEIDWSQIQNQSGKDSSDLKSPVLRGAIQAMIRADKKAKALNQAIKSQNASHVSDLLTRLPSDALAKKRDDLPQERDI